MCCVSPGSQGGLGSADPFLARLCSAAPLPHPFQPAFGENGGAYCLPKPKSQWDNVCTCLKNTEILLSCAQDKSPPILSCLNYPCGTQKCNPLLFLSASGSSCAGSSHFLLGVRRVRGKGGGANGALVSRALGAAASAGGDCLRKSACRGQCFVAESDRFLATKTPLAFLVRRLSLP